MVYFGVVVVSLMVLVILVVGQRQMLTQMGQIEKRGGVIASSVASAAHNALLNYDYSSLQRIVDQMQEQTAAGYVIVHDKEGVVAGFSGRPDLQGQTLDDVVSEEALREGEEVHQRHSGAGHLTSDPDGVIEVALPVHVEGSTTRWGTVRVGLPLSELRSQLQVTFRDLTLLGLLAVVLVLLTARYFTSQITDPLRQIARATGEVANGQLEHELDEDLVGELGETARSFNKMTEDLRRSQDAIRYQKRHLENMVQERTAALRQKARELEKANRELKEVDRLKSDFLSNVSHELRTPLTSIRSFTEILLDSPTAISPEESTEFLTIIASQTDRLTRLIGDLLDLSRIEAGEFRCELEPVPLEEFVLSPALETLRRLFDETGVELRTDFENQLPPILGDADRLSQVITNLVDNSLKFTEPGGTIELAARSSSERIPDELAAGGFFGVCADTPEQGDYVILSVRDNGCGIPLEDRQRIFEKFGQVGNVLTNKPQGTGLGLAICGNILAQHGGAIWVDSEVGVGSTFSISIPVSGSASRHLHSSTPSDPFPALSGTTDDLSAALQQVASGPRVLVIDDDEDAVKHMVRTLEPLGYRAISCLGGRDALQKVQDLKPDAVVLDALMPDRNGYEVLRDLKNDGRTSAIPVVVLGPLSEMAKSYELGAAVHITRDEEEPVVVGDDSALVNRLFSTPGRGRS
jgi:signal transduction histidine kinase/CheY-like chemotaxis protein